MFINDARNDEGILSGDIVRVEKGRPLIVMEGDPELYYTCTLDTGYKLQISGRELDIIYNVDNYSKRGL